jgi:hypothetical protein
MYIKDFFYLQEQLYKHCCVSVSVVEKGVEAGKKLPRKYYG